MSEKDDFINKLTLLTDSVKLCGIQSLTDEELSTLSETEIMSKGFEMIYNSQPKSMKLTPKHPDYKKQLFEEFKKSLEKGVQLSRKNFDTYTVQDDDHFYSKNVIHVKLIDGQLTYIDDEDYNYEEENNEVNE